MFRYTGSTPSDYHAELVQSEVGEHPEEPEDDYTPLDPAYLPPGIKLTTIMLYSTFQTIKNCLIMNMRRSIG